MKKKYIFKNPLSNGLETIAFIPKINGFLVLECKPNSKLKKNMIFGKKSFLYKKLFKIKKIWYK